MVNFPSPMVTITYRRTDASTPGTTDGKQPALLGCSPMGPGTRLPLTDGRAAPDYPSPMGQAPTPGSTGFPGPYTREPSMGWQLLASPGDFELWQLKSYASTPH